MSVTTGAGGRKQEELRELNQNEVLYREGNKRECGEMFN